jgi:hypothetical protein
VEIHHADPALRGLDGDELHVAGMMADVAFGDVAALAMDEHVAGVDDVESLGDQHHQSVVIEIVWVEEDTAFVEQRADLLLALDHDRVLVERMAAGDGAVEPVVARRPDLLEAEDIGVAMGVQEAEEFFTAGKAAPGVETDELHQRPLPKEGKKRCEGPDGRKVRMLRIEVEREEDGRWLAEVPAIPGVLVYGDTEAVAERERRLWR